MKAGYVPTARVAPILRTLILERWPHGTGVDVLAEKTGYDVSAIDGVLNQDNEGSDFDFVDRLFCALGRPDILDTGALSDIFWSIEFRETCALEGCYKRFPERGAGSRRRRYCSRQCRQLAHLIKLGKATGLKARGRCLKGHRLTPENTILRADGHKECRTCSLERRRERYANDPEYRSRAAAASKAWYKRQKAAA